MLEWLLVGALASALVLWLALGGPGDRIDNAVYDVSLRARQEPADESILVVAIDSRSIEAIGRWPWSRTEHARLIDRLADAGAAAVAYDILFTEPEPAADGALATALERAGNVYLPVITEQWSRPDGQVRVVQPVAPLSAAAAGLGHVMLTPDGDGVLRRLPLFIAADGRTWRHLMLAASGAVEPPPDSGSIASDPGMRVLDARLVDYAGLPGAFRTVSFVDVLQGEVPNQFIEGKIVLVGAMAEGLGDVYATPVTRGGELRPGLDVQANLLNALLSGSRIETLPRGVAAALSLLPLWSLMLGFLWLRPVANMVLGLVLAASILTLSALALVAGGVWLPPAAAICGLAAAYLAWSWRRLTAASLFLQTELDKFDSESPRIRARGFSGDVLSRQAAGLRRAMRLMRDFDRFVGDVLRSLPDATVVIDANGRITLFNDRAASLFGDRLFVGADIQTLLEAIGQLSWTQLIAPEGTRELEVVTPNSHVLKIDQALLAEAPGPGPGRIVRFADVTAMRSAERQREHALQLLTHDMRAPQVSILTMLQNPRAISDPDTVKRIVDCAQMTLHLAESFVQLARAESKSLDGETLDLSQILTDAADILWPQAKAKNLMVLTPAEDEEFLVVGDRTLITRALTNLLDNAIRHSPERGLIECSLDKRQENGFAVCICTIRDQGPGFSEQARDHLFQPFSSGASAGAGLGLAFVRTVMDRHGGHVRHQSISGGGAALVLTLPCAPDEESDQGVAALPMR